MVRLYRVVLPRLPPFSRAEPPEATRQPVERILIRHIRGMRSSCCSARRVLSARVTVTVVVRWEPWLSPPCGTRVARPASTTSAQPGGVGFQLGRWARLVPADSSLVGKSQKGSR
jgi:hypothetical protein